MSRYVITLYVGWLALVARTGSRVARGRDERGSVTMEQVLWAVAMIAIVGIVVAAIKTYVTSEAAKIR